MTSPTPSDVLTAHSVGVDYCLTHCGIRNEDEPACDFADMEDEELECDLRPLVWIDQ